MKLYKSRYNIYYQLEDDKYLYFNTLTRRFFEVSSSAFEVVQKILDNPSHYISIKSFDKIIQNLKDNGFLSEEQDDIKKLKLNYQDSLNVDKYTLLIMPTYHCNFSCWYCVQKHEKMFLSKEDELKIQKHIAKYMLENKLRELHITWFGGEPLLATDKIISIAEYAKSFCEKEKLFFSCSITTNGALLTKELLQSIAHLNFTSFQITLDGDKERHNKIRLNAKIRDSFSLILNNVVEIAKVFPRASIIIRINYDEKTLNSQLFKDLDTYLYSIKAHVVLIFRKVWQVEETDLMRNQVLVLSQLFQSRGYKVEHDFDDFNLISCFVEQKHYHSIFPNGSIDRCNNKDIAQARGFLDEEGGIRWHKTPTEKSISSFSLNTECGTCIYLPLCTGPCPKMKERVKSLEQLPCIYENKDIVLRKEIIQYYKLNKSMV